ncbi:fungal-specific transcription factor domain-containing protein [Aspergillus pseudocaelatus]|uniref:Fungal-specific transcription factor domain-containing protein n=1 Tax=Aspergillus pseudocaelatus TaxID=1825620 RepID=A0ABQ6WW11_9EURO|nr:fungal-specific transcription factor domain-containing protein [Aspergillus pseudocaelatus]
MACRSCRLRKVRCDRTRPSCKNCMQRGDECIYVGERRKRRKLDDGSADSLPRDAHERPSTKPQETASPLVVPHNQFLYMSDLGSVSSSTGSVRITVSESTTDPWQEELLDQILDGDDTDPLRDRHPAIWMRTDDAEEYSGPSSGIAGISDLGLKWIRSRVPESDELCRTIEYVREGLMTHLRQCIPRQSFPNPEMSAVWTALPPPHTVRKYVDTYFSTVQTVFPVVDPVLFDEMLTEWYQQPSCQSDSWKALLNAVLASGCRAALSNDTASAFQISSSQSWGLFQNALNYEPKLVHSATDLLAVQALVVMAVFAQGMSCSQRLEYILCSTAARLAHSLALNRHVPRKWRMSEREQRERHRLFWVIYCLDKSIALRSGRPPVIHDEDISCPFPRDVRYGTARVVSMEREVDTEEVFFDFFLCLARFYRICSLMTQKLYSTLALCQPTSRLQTVANGILTRLEKWRESIPEQFRPGQSFSRLPMGGLLLRMQVLVLHFSYYYAVCAVHRRFTPMFLQGNEEDKAAECTPQGSSVTHIEAARSMALLTKYLDVESYTPAWLLFYYPTTALATIFMHTVTAPLSVSALSDIALMEAVAGLFGRLEFMTFGEAAFTKTSEFARQARCIVEKALSQNQSKRRVPGESTGQKEMLHPSSVALTSEMKDTLGNRRPGITVHDNEEDLTNPSAQPTVLEPITSTLSTQLRHSDLDCTGSQVTDPIANRSGGGWNPPDFGHTPSSLCNHMTDDIDLSFVDLPGGHLSDEWLSATRLDLA